MKHPVRPRRARDGIFAAAKRVVGIMFERRTAENGALTGERAVRRCLIAALALLACLGSSAQAQYDRDQRGPWMQGRERGDRGDSRSDRGRGRDNSQGRQSDRERGGSLSPDERRELNRDLQRANREFYRKGREGR